LYVKTYLSCYGVRHCKVSLGSTGLLRETNVKPSLCYRSTIKKERGEKTKKAAHQKKNPTKLGDIRNYSYHIENETIFNVQYSVKQVIIGCLRIRYTLDPEATFDSNY